MIDTAAKRRSAAGTPFLPLGPGVTPDASKPVAWRQQAAWGYSGVAAGAPPLTGSGAVRATAGALGRVSASARSADRVAGDANGLGRVAASATAGGRVNGVAGGQERVGGVVRSY